MKTWTIPISWSVGTSIQIKAKTLSEAIDKAYKITSLPTDAEYIDDSLTVDGDEEDIREDWNDGQND